MISGVKDEAVVELAVDIEEIIPQAAQDRCRHQGAVDQNRPPAAALELAGDDELSLVSFDVIGGEEPYQVLRHGCKKERAFDEKALCSVADEGGRRPFSGQHADGVEEDRFAGPGFAGKNRHAFP